MQDDCFAGAVQEFLICTTVHKAHDILGASNSDVYVRISLDKVTKYTRTFQHTENPFFNEYFVYELKCSLTELLRLTILYEVKRRSTCKKNVGLGELLIDLNSVWSQPNRCYFKKWGRLEAPIATHKTSAPEHARGYLQIDLAIVSQSSNPSNILRPEDNETLPTVNRWPTHIDYDNIEQNLLQNLDPHIQCNIRYVVGIYRGCFTKKNDYLIQYRFHPFKGKTPVSKTSSQPVWNHEVRFSWTFPSLAQTFFIQLFAHEHFQWKCIAEYELHLDDIAFKDKPALGPTFLHLYDALHPINYIGRILIEVRSELLEADPVRVLSTHAVQPIEEKRYWKDEVFQIDFLPLQGDFVHGNMSNCKISIKLAEFHSNLVECFLKPYHGKFISPIHLKHFQQELPFKSCVMKATLPDYRVKYESDFFIQDIVDYMKNEVDTFKLFQLKYTNQFQMQAKCLKSIIMAILTRIKDGVERHRFDFPIFTDRTIWDINRQLYLLDYFAKVPNTLRNLRLKIKSAYLEYLDYTIDEVVQDLIMQISELSSLLTTARIQDDWPELMLMLSVGSKDIGYCRLNAKHFFDTHKRKEANTSGYCWRVKHFVFKDTQCQHSCFHCGCHVASVLGCLAIVADQERREFITSITHEWMQTEPMYWTPTIPYTNFKCRLFIHQAKVRPCSHHNGLCDAHLRIIIVSNAVETHTIKATLSPIWNLVISLDTITLPGPIQWYLRNPPQIALEIYDTDKFTADEYLGCGFLSAMVISSDRADENAREEIGTPRRPFYHFVKTRNTMQKFQRLKSVTPPPLKWVPIAANGMTRAAVLMSAELVEMYGDLDRPDKTEVNTTTGIPSAIRPNMLNFVLEVIFVGLRNYTKGILGTAGKHRIKLMMGDLVLTSGLSTSRIKNSINFLVLYASGVVSLPDQQEYWPAIIATDMAVTSLGAESTVGAVLIPNSKNFLQKDKSVRCTPAPDIDNSNASTVLTVDPVDVDDGKSLFEKPRKENICVRICCFLGLCKRRRAQQRTVQKCLWNVADLLEERDFSWWTKFYNSMYWDQYDCGENHKHRLVIYTCELEKQPEFNNLHDWAIPLQMVHGVKHKKNGPPKEDVYATLKLQLKLSPCHCEGGGDAGDGVALRPLAKAMNPRYQAVIQSLAELCKVTVRVYIVQGLHLRFNEKYTHVDTYVKLQLGVKTISDRANYVPNRSNPVFGKAFQLDAVLPREHMLQITIFNKNTLRDDIIGSTVIDIEDRWRTQHRATVGIANEYSKSGYNAWRDVSTPYEILTNLCYKNDVPAPIIFNNVLEVDNVFFSDETFISKDEELQERLSLTALKHLKQLSSFGYKLIPEHVETRSLYREENPGVEQGKLQMWVELFEGNLNIPPPIDITPFPPQDYEIRVVIHNCDDVILDDRNIFGKLMSDIYVVGWCQDAEEYQSTDVHYRSLKGEANFNWRMIFSMKYSPSEDMMVVKRRSDLHQVYETKQPPTLYFQIWDKDLISRDDFLASLDIQLSNFPEPFPTAKSCTFFGADRKHLNLFRRKSIRGWFPMGGSTKGKYLQDHDSLNGKIELEISVATEAEASSYPAGIGREPPDALTAPIRATTSFNPVTNPLRTLSKIVWPAVRKYVLIMTLLVLIGMSIFLFLANLPAHILSAPLI